ncbi:MAG TPA: DUF6785 family protein [Planctomycetota bacterium]|nr:DUF6785 family protein [Planctomycetota bacterium]
MSDLPPVQRAFTVRSVALGVGLVALFAIAAPVNDWMVGNTYLYCHYLPPGVLMVVLTLALVVNPLLGRRRFASGEMVVAVAMLLALGGVCSNGFARLWTQMASGPARRLPASAGLEAIAPRDGPAQLPAGFFIGVPTDRPIDANDPEHRLVIDGFHDGLRADPRVEHRALVTWRDAAGVQRTQPALGGAVARQTPPGTFLDLDAAPGLALVGLRPGDSTVVAGATLTVVAVEPPGIPWHAWWPAFLRWLPLIAGALVALIAIAALVRDQWVVHERLPYPIADFLYGFLKDPDPGRRLPPILCSRLFWIGVAVAAVILGSQGLEKMGLLPVSITTQISLHKAADTPELKNVFQWWAVFGPRLFLSIAALTFFLPLDLGFSLWFFFLLTGFSYYVLRLAGVPIERADAAPAGVGGFAMQALLILWLGRTHYLGAIKAALGLGRPELRPVAPYVWALFAGVAAIGLTLVAAGARPDHAALAVIAFLGFTLVLARLVAEAGIPFVQMPIGWFVSQTVFSLTGFAVPVAALAPLMLIGLGLLPDSRENLLPYAVQAEYLGHRAGVPRRRLSLAMAMVAIGGAAACAAVMIAIYYRHEHVTDTWPLDTLMGNNIEPLARGAAGQDGAVYGRAWLAYGVGALLVGIVGVGRMLFAWWPLHPLGLLIVPAFSTWLIWGSFLVGWAAKAAVMRYGGVGVYQRVKPFAAGLIAGEAAMAALFLIVGLVRYALGHGVSGLPRFLPG